MLSCINLHYNRGENPIFAGLGLSLLPGCLLWLQGGNGSGKTSFIKTLAGILKPQAGEITWHDMPISGNSEYLDDTLYIGHKNAMKNSLTVAENLSFWSNQRNTKLLLPAAIQFWGLEEVEDTPYGRLSAGWQRKVALARLVATPAKLWLLDEPATHLDVDGENRLSTVIASRCRQNGIVIYSSHKPLAGLKSTATLSMEDYKAEQVAT